MVLSASGPTQRGGVPGAGCASLLKLFDCSGGSWPPSRGLSGTDGVEWLEWVRGIRTMGNAMYFELLTVLLFGLLWIGIVTFLRLKKKEGLVHLIFFTIFYAYLFKVLDYTLFQFQSLLLLKHSMPNLILQGETADKSLNLIPLITLTPEDLETSLLNILLLFLSASGCRSLRIFA
jgi:hypothetical protein